MPVDVNRKGFKELENALAELAVPVQKKIMRSSLREAATPMLSQMKSDIRAFWGEQSGVLEKSVAMRTSFPTVRKGPADGYVNVGVFRIRSLESIGENYYGRTYIGAANLAWWFEKGVQAHSLQKKARAGGSNRSSKLQGHGSMHPGIPANPVIRRTFDQEKEKVIESLKSDLGSKIQRIWAKKKKGK
jgi:hypothetical protein